MGKTVTCNLKVTLILGNTCTLHASLGAKLLACMLRVWDPHYLLAKFDLLIPVPSLA